MSAFPLSPLNGQTVTVNGVVYTYNTTKTAWVVTSSGGSLLVVSSLSVSGNITAANFSAGTITATLSSATTAGSITSQANSATITAATANTANQIVLRDASGNFSAGTITATLSGSATSATSATTAGTVTTAAQPNITSVGTLSSLTSGSIYPTANNTDDLGTSANRWRNIYTNDFHLSNGIGDYTIVEGEENLFLYNNKNGKVYKFVVQEVDPQTAPKKTKTE